VSKAWGALVYVFVVIILIAVAVELVKPYLPIVGMTLAFMLLAVIVLVAVRLIRRRRRFF
jgi:hypothetical protein